MNLQELPLTNPVARCTKASWWEVAAAAALQTGSWELVCVTHEKSSQAHVNAMLLLCLVVVVLLLS